MPERRNREGASFCERLRSRLLRGGGGASGLFVVDAGSGKALCARAARRQRPLASNMKMFTTATALARFGPEATIATKVLADGEIDAGGVLHGNLYLQGGGDPALGTPAFYNRFLGGLGTDLYGLKRQIRAAGVTAVSGRLYADDDIFDRRRGVADSGYATSPYIGPLSGLSLNSGYRTSDGSRLRLRPGPDRRRESWPPRCAPPGCGSPGPSPAATPPRREAETIAVVRSPSIDALANVTAVYSNNFFAEMLIKLLGARVRPRRDDRRRRRRGRGIRPRQGNCRPRGRRLRPDPRQPRLARSRSCGSCRRCG